ncbi:unnamed protein product, partial [Hapterophycus canaliculatus]
QQKQIQQQQQQRQQPLLQQQQRRETRINSNARSTFVAAAAGAAGAAPAKQKTPGESWLVNSSGRFVAPAAGAVAAAAAAAAAASGTPAGSGSPILTALKANASKKILPVPMVVTSGTPEMNNKCPECKELVRARLDEPTLLREDRHYWDFDNGDEDDDTGDGDQGDHRGDGGDDSGGMGRRAASTWRPREKTRTFHIGIILCLNSG